MFAKTINNDTALTYVDIMKNAITTKYRFIRYYYTQLTLMQQGMIGTFYKPLYFEFPNDSNAYADTERNIMIGDALKLSVVSNELGTEYANFYFPTGTWCDLLKDNLKD
jgi:alpha-glucosidase (family GH31 glycosyl hydrolase)